MNPKTLEMIAKAKARLAEMQAAKEAALAATVQELEAHKLQVPAISDGLEIDNSRDWNQQQLAAIHSGMAGKSFCLIGAAGTGKTSTLKGLVNSMIRNNLLPVLKPEENTKVLKPGMPGIVLVSFTNVAVRQIAKHFSSDIHCSTIHNLVEFKPFFYEVVDAETGLPRTTMRFEPSRTALNPLPAGLKTIVVDESSMVSDEHIQWICSAILNLPNIQWIFVGDLNQIPPVFGGAILGRKLLELPVIELTEVYRQALESPIISLATDVKNGKPIPVSADKKIIMDGGEHGKVTIHPWSKLLYWEDALTKIIGFCRAAFEDGVLDWEKDMILCPQGKPGVFGAHDINVGIAQYMGAKRQAKVYEIVAGFNHHYYAVGDKVLVNKREAVITHIDWNRDFGGKPPINPEHFLIDRYGGAKKRKQELEDSEQEQHAFSLAQDFDADAILGHLSSDVQDRVNQSSHRITCCYLDCLPEDLLQKLKDGKPLLRLQDYELLEFADYVQLQTSAEVNSVLFGYVITCHKSQGSEWRKVFVLLHDSHAKMMYRELIYTSITRAAKELYMVVEPERGLKSGSLTKAVLNPRIKGNTLPEKLLSLKERFTKEAAEKLSLSETDSD